MSNKRMTVFIILSCTLSVLHALGYVWQGIQCGFNCCIIAMIFLDLLYLPCTLLRKFKWFSAYLVLFSTTLVFICAFTMSELYNNYSGLLCMFIAMMLFPKMKRHFMCFYLIISAIAFCLANDSVCFLVIHYSRALWLFCIYDFILYERYNRKPVVLYEDEQKIIQQLCENKHLKELELDGYSESTIRRRIEAAKQRNGVKDIEDLKELYQKTYLNKND